MPRRRLGQHFLKDRSVIARILAEAGLGPQDRILEIGPGRGALTLDLARTAQQVLAVELDRDLAERLPDHPHLKVVQGDILQVDLESLLAPHEDWKVVANLPYYITTPILDRLLTEGKPRILGMWVMVQKEVAERMCARGTRESGSLSHFVQYHAEVRTLFRVRPGSFQPPPEVDSAVVRLLPHRVPPVEAPPDLLFRLIRTAFGGRRKTLRRSLAGVLSDPVAVLEAAGIDPTRRPETLVLEEFAALARAALAQG